MGGRANGRIWPHEGDQRGLPDGAGGSLSGWTCSRPTSSAITSLTTLTSAASMKALGSGSSPSGAIDHWPMPAFDDPIGHSFLPDKSSA